MTITRERETFFSTTAVASCDLNVFPVTERSFIEWHVKQSSTGKFFIFTITLHTISHRFRSQIVDAKPYQCIRLIASRMKGRGIDFIYYLEAHRDRKSNEKWDDDAEDTNESRQAMWDIACVFRSVLLETTYWYLVYRGTTKRKTKKQKQANDTESKSRIIESLKLWLNKETLATNTTSGVNDIFFVLVYFSSLFFFFNFLRIHCFVRFHFFFMTTTL